VLVTLGVVGPQAGGFHVDVDLAGFRLGAVKAEVAVEVLEGTVDEAVAQVADLPVDERVLAFLVDLVSAAMAWPAESRAVPSARAAKVFFNMLSFLCN
jgi:hypothetical protein